MTSRDLINAVVAGGDITSIVDSIHERITKDKAKSVQLHLDAAFKELLSIPGGTPHAKAIKAAKEWVATQVTAPTVSEPDMRAIEAFKQQSDDAVKGTTLRYTGDGRRGELLRGDKRIADWVSGKPYISPKAPPAVHDALRN